MFKLNDYLVYQKNIYQIIGIKYKYLNNQDYYILNSALLSLKNIFVCGGHHCLQNQVSSYI